MTRRTVHTKRVAAIDPYIRMRENSFLTILHSRVGFSFTKLDTHRYVYFPKLKKLFYTLFTLFFTNLTHPKPEMTEIRLYLCVIYIVMNRT